MVTLFGFSGNQSRMTLCIKKKKDKLFKWHKVVFENIVISNCPDQKFVNVLLLYGMM